MTSWTSHLIIAPILLPLVVSAAMLLIDERRRKIKRVMSLAATLALLVNAVALLRMVTAPDASGAAAPMVYLLGNWPAPFGIVLVADRLSVMLVLLASILAFASLVYSQARWDREGPRFHALFMLLLMGVNGAFLTGDIFNLFVFFEVLLAASYGLALHGSGVERTKRGLHYVVINVATSLLFLIGVSLIYSVTGALNMADIAVKIPDVPPQDLMLLQGGAAILGVAFLVKAGIWPLSFWLPPTYAVATPPVAALFAILSKVGIYIIVRLSSLLFDDEAGSAAHFADNGLIVAGVATIIYGMIGVLSARTLAKIAGHYILISSGTLLAAVGTGSFVVLAGALFYLISSTLTVSAFYLVIELIKRGDGQDDSASAGEPVFEDEYTGIYSEEGEDEVGVAIPASLAIVGGGFAFCALLLSGLPPLSGFIAKFAILDGVLRSRETIDAAIWLYIATIILSGLCVLIATSRAGIDMIWTPNERPVPKLAIVEAAPVGLLLALSLVLMIQAGPVMRFLEETAKALDHRQIYIEAVGAAKRSGRP